MKLYNIVFSPTGGTKKVSALLTDALEGEAANVDLTDSKQNFRTVQRTQEDIAVISVPSYGGRVPAVAVERLTMLRGQGARAVLVCVYGNRAYEDTLVELEDAAKQAGFRVSAAVAAIAEHSIARQFAAGRPDTQDVKQLSDFARQIQRKLSAEDSTEPTIPGNRPYKKAGARAWCPNPQRNVPNAAPARRNVPCRPLIRKIRKRWMRRRVSPACAVSPSAPTLHGKSIPLCSLPPV